MRFEHAVRVPATRDRVWALLMDVPTIARCVPGADDVVETAAGTYRGAVRVSVGPVRLRLEGTVAMTQKDEQSGHAVMRLDATDKAVGGNVRAEVRMTLAEVEAGVTEVRLVTETTLAGRIGDLGQPLIKRQADRVVSEFARCLERTLAAVPGG
jgi:carbon monoxide dehydrogenase subunit G